MVKNKTGGNKSKNIGNKNNKKIIQSEPPDFENSFFAEVVKKPNGLITEVKILYPPTDKNSTLPFDFENEFLRGPVQANIGKLKNDKRSNFLNPGDIVQVEINFDLKRKNGSTFAYLLCKYSSTDVRQFKKSMLIQSDDKVEGQLEEDDPFLNSCDEDEDNDNKDTKLDDL